ncbi:putative oxidoreductase [Colletotrichum siamense]|uniref:putative oxidoreductase n=1 Tax=Colletotrichum siamense TaxID=690259 RepID=UPI001872BCAE|nr:putative oxidoreductase [Colletotrichum siamense]KAF5510484.1 putative oxidoreductase [Colletotrichum siamense]
MPTYVITGARDGIGLEYVAQLSLRPATTVLALVRSLAADLARLRAIQASPDRKGAVHVLECDISSPESLAALPSRVSAAVGDGPNKIDVLINNAATLQNTEQRALSLDAAALETHMTTNVVGPARTLQVLFPFFHDCEQQDRRTVVANITSGAGSFGWVTSGVCPHELTPYAISKAALNMLTVHQAMQLKGRGVVVVAVDPGHVKTKSGGPGAKVEVADCAGGILKLLGGLGVEDSGKLFLYDGREIPW